MLSRVVGMTQSLEPMRMVSLEKGKPVDSLIWKRSIICKSGRISSMPMLVDTLDSTAPAAFRRVSRSAVLAFSTARLMTFRCLAVRLKSVSISLSRP